MTGRQREALERRVRSAIYRLNDLAYDLRVTGQIHDYSKLEDAAFYLGGLLDGPLAVGSLQRSRYPEAAS